MPYLIRFRLSFYPDMSTGAVEEWTAVVGQSNLKLTKDGGMPTNIGLFWALQSLVTLMDKHEGERIGVIRTHFTDNLSKVYWTRIDTP
jgi:hypothetical protein